MTKSSPENVKLTDEGGIENHTEVKIDKTVVAYFGMN